MKWGPTVRAQFNGEKLKQARLDAHLSKNKLRIIVGVTLTTLTNWEKGRSVPNSDRLAIISAAVQKPLIYFYD